MLTCNSVPRFRRYLKSNFAFLTASTFFLSNVIGLHATESNIWADRERRAKRVGMQSVPLFASLPANIPSHVLSELPSVSSTSLNQLTPALTKQIQTQVPKSSVAEISSLIQALPPTCQIRHLSFPSGHCSDKIVIHIQDIHLNFEAQKNIAASIQGLADKGKVKLVALEGAFEPLDMYRFHAFPDKETLKTVADDMLIKNEIPGPVYMAMTSGKSIPPFVGVDDRDQHHRNVEAYRQSVALASDYKEQLASLQKENITQKSKTFNPTLFAFDAQVQAYRENHLSLGDYVKDLTNSARTIGDDTRHFLTALTAEKGLDFPLVEKERGRLIEELISQLDKAQMEELLNHSVAYRLGQIGYGSFYRYLQDICHRASVDLSRYAALRSYMDYVFMSDQINAERLFQDMVRMEKEGFDRLVKTNAEQRILVESQYLHYIGKLLDFTLTPEEWRDYAKIAKPHSGLTPFPQDLSIFESFYLEAEKRNDSMVNNLLSAMSQRGASTAVLVTGGFHTDGMEELFRQRGITCVTVSPKVTKVDTAQGSAYLTVFTQEKTPLEKIFEGEKLFVAQELEQRRVFLSAGAQAEVVGRLPEGEAMRRLAPEAFSKIQSVTRTVLNPISRVVIRFKSGRELIEEDRQNGSPRIHQQEREIPLRLRVNPINLLKEYGPVLLAVSLAVMTPAYLVLNGAVSPNVFVKLELVMAFFGFLIVGFLTLLGHKESNIRTLYERYGIRLTREKFYGGQARGFLFYGIPTFAVHLWVFNALVTIHPVWGPLLANAVSALSSLTVWMLFHGYGWNVRLSPRNPGVMNLGEETQADILRRYGFHELSGGYFHFAQYLVRLDAADNLVEVWTPESQRHNAPIANVNLVPYQHDELALQVTFENGDQFTRNGDGSGSGGSSQSNRVPLTRYNKEELVEMGFSESAKESGVFVANLVGGHGKGAVVLQEGRVVYAGFIENRYIRYANKPKIKGFKNGQLVFQEGPLEFVLNDYDTPETTGWDPKSEMVLPLEEDQGFTATDESGFSIGGTNTNATIAELKALTGVPIDEIERRARPGRLSDDGFLGKDESFTEVLAKDNAFVVTQGLTHQQLAEPLFHAINMTRLTWSRGDGKPLAFTYKGQRYTVFHIQWRGSQESIFNDGLMSSRDYEVTNLDTKQSIGFSEFLADYIWRYGFYEGNTAYRVDPARIIAVFGLKGQSSTLTVPGTSRFGRYPQIPNIPTDRMSGVTDPRHFLDEAQDVDNVLTNIFRAINGVKYERGLRPISREFRSNFKSALDFLNKWEKHYPADRVAMARAVLTEVQALLDKSSMINDFIPLYDQIEKNLQEALLKSLLIWEAEGNSLEAMGFHEVGNRSGVYLSAQSGLLVITDPTRRDGQWVRQIISSDRRLQVASDFGSRTSIKSDQWLWNQLSGQGDLRDQLLAANFKSIVPGRLYQYEEEQIFVVLDDSGRSVQFIGQSRERDYYKADDHTKLTKAQIVLGGLLGSSQDQALWLETQDARFAIDDFHSVIDGSLTVKQEEIPLPMTSDQTFEEARDATTGFQVGGINSDDSIAKLTQMTGVPIAQIEQSARPGASSSIGFLNAHESFLGVLRADNRFVRSQGYTHRELAEPLFYAMNLIHHFGARNIPSFIYGNRRYAVKMTAWRGIQPSIFRDKLGASTDYAVVDLETGEAISFSALVPHYIWRYGFYEGHTNYRVDPAQIIRVFHPRADHPILRAKAGETVVIQTVGELDALSRLPASSVESFLPQFQFVITDVHSLRIYLSLVKKYPSLAHAQVEYRFTPFIIDLRFDAANLDIQRDFSAVWEQAEEPIKNLLLAALDAVQVKEGDNFAAKIFLERINDSRVGEKVQYQSSKLPPVTVARPVPIPALINYGVGAEQQLTPSLPAQIVPPSTSGEVALNPDQTYAATDPSGFKIGGSNSNKTIDAMSSLTGKEIQEIERNGRPRNSSMSGFLADGESFKEVLKGDNDYVNAQGFTHQALARHLFSVMNLAGYSGGTVSYLGRGFKVSSTAYRGMQESIFNDRLGTNQDWVVENIETGARIEFSGLVPYYIWRYGFYEGHTSYRLEPSQIIQVFGLLKPVSSVKGSITESSGSQRPPTRSASDLGVIVVAVFVLPWLASLVLNGWGIQLSPQEVGLLPGLAAVLSAALINEMGHMTEVGIRYRRFALPRLGMGGVLGARFFVPGARGWSGMGANVLVLTGLAVAFATGHIAAPVAALGILANLIFALGPTDVADFIQQLRTPNPARDEAEFFVESADRVRQTYRKGTLSKGEFTAFVRETLDKMPVSIGVGFRQFAPSQGFMTPEDFGAALMNYVVNSGRLGDQDFTRALNLSLKRRGVTGERSMRHFLSESLSPSGTHVYFVDAQDFAANPTYWRQLVRSLDDYFSPRQYLVVTPDDDVRKQIIGLGLSPSSVHLRREAFGTEESGHRPVLVRELQGESAGGRVLTRAASVTFHATKRMTMDTHGLDERTSQVLLEAANNVQRLLEALRELPLTSYQLQTINKVVSTVLSAA